MSRVARSLTITLLLTLAVLIFFLISHVLLRTQYEGNVEQHSRVVSSPEPTSRTPEVTVLDPISINALPGLSSGTSWDSGSIALAAPSTLTGDGNGVIIDVRFADGLLRMADTTGLSLEKLTVELLGTVITPEDGEAGDLVDFGVHFDGRGFSAPAGGAVNISSAAGTGSSEQSVDLTNSEFPLGGFTLQIYQNAVGSVEITGLRIGLAADRLERGSSP
jgi:hypothetical protein